MLRNEPIVMWLVQLAITGLFTFFTVWLYKNIHIKNAHKKWFRVLFNSISWTYVIQAMDFMEEIDTFKKDA
jgi:hypothetical protein